MKSTLLLIVFTSYVLSFCEAQTDSVVAKNLFGVCLGNSTYQPSNTSSGSKQNFESLNESSNSFDVLTSYKRYLSKALSVQTGLDFTERYSANNISDSINLKTFERFISVPLILCVSFNKLQNLHGLKASVNFGVAFSFLFNQKLYTPSGTSLPGGFNSSYGFGKYLKWGTLIELNSEIPFQNEKAGIMLALRYFTEIKKNEIFKADEIAFTPSYRGLTTMLGVYKRF